MPRQRARFTWSAAREAALQLCLESLPPRSRHILTARYDFRHPCGEIAQATGSSLKAIHQILSRLRRSLHRCITTRLENEDFQPAPPARDTGEICPDTSPDAKPGPPLLPNAYALPSRHE